MSSSPAANCNEVLLRNVKCALRAHEAPLRGVKFALARKI